ncbi:MAG: hypothetical protein KDA61_04445, partial [Planctomycetales bacterium]|nr:hypothetical protein [Planctomycetales bacterium]
VWQPMPLLAGGGGGGGTTGAVSPNGARFIASAAPFTSAYTMPLETTCFSWYQSQNAALAADAPRTLDAGNNPNWSPTAGVAPSDAMQQRQLLARHLYVLAMTLVADDDHGIAATMPDDQRALAERLAQWSINAVDFRDPDNIMTPFEYDANPFDGWDVDGELRTRKDVYGDDEKFGGDDANADRGGVVWGCERPELLITETMAWHDRRTTDESEEQSYPIDTKEDASHGNARGNKPPDSDYDQRDRPRGALFVELYNPWGPTPGVNADTHVRDNNLLNATLYNNSPQAYQSLVDGGVDMSAYSENARKNGLKSPVWRLTIHKRRFKDESHEAGEMAQWDPDAQDAQMRPPTPADRSIYFGGYDPEYLDDGVAYFNYTGQTPPQDNSVNRTLNSERQQAYTPERAGAFNPAAHMRQNPTPPVRPGRYLVVGAGNDYDNDGVYETAICHRPGSDSREFAAKALGEDTRRIELVPNINARGAAANGAPVRMCDGKGTAITDPDANLNFRVECPQETAEMPGAGNGSPYMADVAIIDYVLDPRDNYDDRNDSHYPYRNPATGMAYGLKRRRVTLSEPAAGYITKFKGKKWSEKEQSYVKVEDPTSETPLDIPLDGPINVKDMNALISRINSVEGKQMARADERELAEMFPPDGIDPALTKVDRYSDRTEDPRVSYAVVYLQRLANPLWAWNPPPGNPEHDPELPVNPYRTVDTTCSNLTVFNSRTEKEEDGTSSGQTGTHFASCERGEPATDKARSFVKIDALSQMSSGAASNASSPLWLQQPATPERVGRNAEYRPLGENRYQRVRPNDQVGTGYHMKTIPYCSLGFLNRAFQNTDAAAAGQTPLAQGYYDLRAVPKRPFAAIPWPNRPYISGNELMLVPRTRSSQLLRQVTLNDPTKASDPEAVYKLTIDGEGKVVGGDANLPFPFLENFFFTDSSGNTDTKGAPKNMHRVLDYVQTKSLFAGTNAWLNPYQFALSAMNPSSPTIGGRLDPRFNFLAPFNEVSSYREPGKINLNTVCDTDVNRALYHLPPKRAAIIDANNNGRPNNVEGPEPEQNEYIPNPNDPLGIQNTLNEFDNHPGPLWNVSRNTSVIGMDGQTASSNVLSFIDSRRGDGRRSQPILNLEPQHPSFFSNPFRNSGSSKLVPINRLMTTGVDATMLRSGDPRNGRSLEPNETPLFAANTRAAHRHSGRNAADRYQPLVRLDNLTTTRSNVYATWVTIGFFEVEEAPTLQDFVRRNGMDDSNWTDEERADLYRRVYPEGYQLG